MTCDAAPATRAAAACRCRLCLRRLDVCLSCVRKARPTSRNLARPHTEHTPCMLCMRGVRPAAARARARVRTHAWERRGPAHRQHAVEEAVDGVQDAPKNVGDGAGAHHRPPVHHPAVFDEHHRACARVVREGLRLPCPPFPRLWFQGFVSFYFFSGHREESTCGEAAA